VAVVRDGVHPVERGKLLDGAGARVHAFRHEGGDEHSGGHLLRELLRRERCSLSTLDLSHSNRSEKSVRK
jgi:hypothetical protein